MSLKMSEPAIWRVNVKPNENGVYPPGLYRVAWKGGGESLAAIGVDGDGKNWIAPTNWVAPVKIADTVPILTVASYMGKPVERFVRLAEEKFAKLYAELQKKSDETIGELERRAVKAIGEASDLRKKNGELEMRVEELGRIEGRYIEACDQINYLKNQNEARAKGCADAQREVESCTKLMTEAREKVAGLTKEILDTRDERDKAQADAKAHFASWKFARDALASIATCLGVDQAWVRDPSDNHSVPVNAVKALVDRVKYRADDYNAVTKENVELRAEVEKWKKDCEAAREHNRSLIDQRRALERGHELALEAERERLKLERRTITPRAQVIFEGMTRCLAPFGGAAEDIAARVGEMLRAAEMEAEKAVVEDGVKMEAPKNFTPRPRLAEGESL